ncbi:hypothetical protein BT69DRAFT_695601 [Atractiella rhizophila]|nr:hypothetical protein BT69DRAFT_695601 [Atractiella rhizophila]
MDLKVNALFLVSPLLLGGKELQSYLTRITSKLQTTYPKATLQLSLQCLSSNDTHTQISKASVEQWKEIIDKFTSAEEDPAICDMGWDAGQEVLEAFVHGLEHLLAPSKSGSNAAPATKEVNHVLVLSQKDLPSSLVPYSPAPESPPSDLGLLIEGDWGCGARNFMKGFWGDAVEFCVGWNEVKDVLIKVRPFFSRLELYWCRGNIRAVWRPIYRSFIGTLSKTGEIPSDDLFISSRVQAYGSCHCNVEHQGFGE